MQAYTSPECARLCVFPEIKVSSEVPLAGQDRVAAFPLTLVLASPLEDGILVEDSIERLFQGRSYSSSEARGYGFRRRWASRTAHGCSW